MRLRPGVYLPREEWDVLDDRDRHLALMHAVVATSGRPVIFSHESAALLHGIPVLRRFPDVPQLTELNGDSARHPRVRTRTHYGALPSTHVIRRGGLLCTTPTRTVVDLATARPFAAGVIAVDALLARVGPVVRNDLAELLGARGPAAGCRRAARVLDTATGLAETPLESASVAFFAEWRIPQPLQQVEFVVDGFRYRADFWWEKQRALGEADGRGKYDDPREIGREKFREDSLRSVVAGFARWGWPELERPSILLARLARAGVTPTRRFASR